MDYSLFIAELVTQLINKDIEGMKKLISDNKEMARTTTLSSLTQYIVNAQKGLNLPNSHCMDFLKALTAELNLSVDSGILELMLNQTIGLSNANYSALEQRLSADTPIDVRLYFYRQWLMTILSGDIDYQLLIEVKNKLKEATEENHE